MSRHHLLSGVFGVLLVIFVGMFAMQMLPNGESSVKAQTSSLPCANGIPTPHDCISNFARNPTIVSAATGQWSNPNTWSLHRLPSGNDVVVIGPSTTVTLDTTNAIAKTFESQGVRLVAMRDNIGKAAMLTRVVPLRWNAIT